MLVEKNLFGTIDRVAEALKLLQDNEPPEGYYVCFSGGKDSVVILDLVKRSGVKFEAWHNITTFEQPELMKFIYSAYPEVQHTHPNTSIYQLIVKNCCLPRRIFRYCCWQFKRPFGKDRFKVTGIRAEESPRRAKLPKLDFSNDLRQLNLIHDWTAAEVWEYIHARNLPYCKLYDEGQKRIGCVFCPFAKEIDNIENAAKYPQFVKYFVTALDRAIAIREEQGKPHKYTSGAEQFKAALDGGRGKTIEDFGYTFDFDTLTVSRIDKENLLTNNKSLVTIPTENNTESNKASTAKHPSSLSVASCITSIKFYRSEKKMSTKINIADFNTIILHAEKISDGQFDFANVLRAELKKKLSIDNADALINLLMTKPEGVDIHNLTRLFLANFNFTVQDGDKEYYLRKFGEDYCELEEVKNPPPHFADEIFNTNEDDSTMENEKLESSTAIVTANGVNLPTTAPTLEQRVIKIQFHLQNMGQSAIIIGQELIECKKEVGHGNWATWLKDNFNLKRQSAQNFMAIAERFSNYQSIGNLGYTQMVQMLALPEGEEENFIAEKAAEGSPVDKMTVKQLRADVKKWKKESEKLQEKSKEDSKEIERLQSVNRNLNNSCTKIMNDFFEANEQKEKLQAKIDDLKNQPPQVIERTETIIPPDYVETKKAAAELQDRVLQLQAQDEENQKTIEDLQNQIFDVISKQPEPEFHEVEVVPEDYEETKQKLAQLEQQLHYAQKSTETLRGEIAAEKYIEQLFSASAALTNSIHYYAALENYMKKNPNTTIKLGQLRCIYEQLVGAFDIIQEKIKI